MSSNNKFDHALTAARRAHASGALRPRHGISQWIEGLLLLGSDVIVLALAFWYGSGVARLATLASAPANLDFLLANPIASHLILYIPATLALILQNWEHGLYTRSYPFWQFLRYQFRSIAVAFLIELALLGYLSAAELDKPAVLQTWFLAALLLPCGRVVIKKILIWTGAGLRPILIVGIGRNSLAAYRALQQESFLGYRVIGFGVQSPENLPEGAHVKIPEATLPVHVLGDKPTEKLKELGWPNVAVALDSLAGSESLLWALGRSSKSLILFPPIRGLPLLGMEVSQLFSQDLLMLRLRNNLGRRGMRAIKWVFDQVAATILLILLSWFFLVIGLWILRSGRPVIYGHERIGQKGKVFRCYKFRTMVPDGERILRDLLERSPEAAAEWAKDFKLRNDPRITPIGRFLRRTSLDELPQLWNVLKGEMSLVGPRPIVLEELARYGEYADYYLQSRPGITGVWQVSGRGDTTYEERVSMDAWYARNWSLWYDFVILVKTAVVLVTGKGAY